MKSLPTPKTAPNPNDPEGQHDEPEGRWDGPIAKAQTQQGTQAMPTKAAGIAESEELPKFQQRLSAGAE